MNKQIFIGAVQICLTLALLMVFPNFALAQFNPDPDNQLFELAEKADKITWDEKLKPELYRRQSAAYKSKNPEVIYKTALAFHRQGAYILAVGTYKNILIHYDTTHWATKASERLLDLRQELVSGERSARTEMAIREADANQRKIESARQRSDAQNKSECEFRISKCGEQCTPLRGQNYQSCQAGCRSICNRGQ